MLVFGMRLEALPTVTETARPRQRRVQTTGAGTQKANASKMVLNTAVYFKLLSDSL
jgi:hypothetical protein